MPGKHIWQKPFQSSLVVSSRLTASWRSEAGREDRRWWLPQFQDTHVPLLLMLLAIVEEVEEEVEVHEPGQPVYIYIYELWLGNTTAVPDKKTQPAGVQVVVFKNSAFKRAKPKHKWVAKAVLW